MNRQYVTKEVLSSYYATFPAGAFELIAKQLKTFSIDDLKIISNDESSVLFTSKLQKERLIELRYFTNVYLVVDDIQKLPKMFINGNYYRLMKIAGNQPKQIVAAERSKIEQDIEQNLKLKNNTHLSNNDFYIIERTSGTSLLALRLPRSKFKRETLQSGELRPELAHILCLAAGINAKHTVLDMFAGYGAIPLEAVRGFGCKKVIALDKERFSKRHENKAIKWHQTDAAQMDFLANNSIDRIVTDPPWGRFDATLDLQTLYTDFLKETQRVLRAGGVAVVLTGYEDAVTAFGEFRKLELIGSWNVLVSGNKATIYKLRKSA